MLLVKGNKLTTNILIDNRVVFFVAEALLCNDNWIKIDDEAEGRLKSTTKLYKQLE